MQPKAGGLILAGGQSRRMGRDKAALRFGVESLLARAIRHMQPVASPIVVSLAPQQAPDPKIDSAGIVYVRDEQAYGGPLPGMVRGFHALAALERPPQAVVIMPVDLPFYTPEWMLRALEGLRGHRACLYRHEGFINALVGAYDLALLPKLDRLVALPRARPLNLSEGEPTYIIDVETVWQAGTGLLPPLMDTDTPEDYAAALALAGLSA